jgi:hypothetical protein
LLKHPVTGIADLAADPIGIWSTIREAYAEGREERRPQCPSSSNFASSTVGKAMKNWTIIKALQFLNLTDQSLGSIFWPYGLRSAIVIR